VAVEVVQEQVQEQVVQVVTVDVEKSGSTAGNPYFQSLLSLLISYAFYASSLPLAVY